MVIVIEVMLIDGRILNWELGPKMRFSSVSSNYSIPLKLNLPPQSIYVIKEITDLKRMMPRLKFPAYHILPITFIIAQINMKRNI